MFIRALKSILAFMTFVIVLIICLPVMAILWLADRGRR